MPLKKGLNKVLVIGSGPIIIGQAAEFDYAGTQACKSLREEGLEVILVNSNPATIMTDANIADRVYMEPLTADFVAKVIAAEKPQGILPTLGGQVGLNLAVELSANGVLKQQGVSLLGTPLESIQKAEDRELFKELMLAIGEPVPESAIVFSPGEALDFARKIGYPVIIRPAYTLGGTGGGVALNEESLLEITSRGLKLSLIHQVLVERSVAGWKEIEYEVMRDGHNNCITICNMENFDPVGIHTGDSIVIAPSQTLSDKDYQMLRTASLKIIRALGIEGGCNIQFALDPNSFAYYIIEVNPRVSRSSALASKATGYPIAKVAAKIAVGLNLDEITNPVTGKSACFEPAMDYVVVKIPRFPFDKFTGADRSLGTQMKATGEVMAIERSLEGALLKAVRSLELAWDGLGSTWAAGLSGPELQAEIRQASDRRLLALADALRRGWVPDDLAGETGIDPFFLQKLKVAVDLEEELAGASGGFPSPEALRRAKEAGISDSTIARLLGCREEYLREKRKELGLLPAFKMVDTCAAEFSALTPYYYSAYDSENELEPAPVNKAVVLGSGPIRIGQGIEFDYCSVHSVWALREAGVQSVIINNNPETVSTDFDTSDRLYFEPLVPEDVLNVLELEQPAGVIVQFGGQTAINLAEPVSRAGFTILGTSVEDIDRAEDRDRFDALLIDLGIPKPPGRAVASLDQALEVARQIGFPVLLRPSYVLGGRAMEIVYNEDDLIGYLSSAVQASSRHAVLVDKYLAGQEVEVDAVSDGRDVLIPGIMEHIERAGVHSGDSIAVYPALSLIEDVRNQIVKYTLALARALNVKGLINIQFVVLEGEVYVLEVNPRSSRTVPFLSKVTGVPMVKLATRVLLGESLRSQGYTSGLYPHPDFVAVKVPVFSFAKLSRVDTFLGPEMKSTGEVIGLDFDLPRALYKGLLAAGLGLAPTGKILATIADKDKPEVLPILASFLKLGYEICATQGTARYLSDRGVKVQVVKKIEEGDPNLLDLIRGDGVALVLNTLTRGRQPERDGFQIRRAAAELGIPCLTSLDTAGALLQVRQAFQQGEEFGVCSLQDYLTGKPGNSNRAGLKTLTGGLAR